MAIFALIGVAFVVVATQAQRSAIPLKRIDQCADPSQPGPAKLLLQQAIRQVLHGSSGTASVIGAHSLLEEMYGSGTLSAGYGYGSVTGVITGSTATCGGQLWRSAGA